MSDDTIDGLEQLEREFGADVSDGFSFLNLQASSSTEASAFVNPRSATAATATSFTTAAAAPTSRPTAGGGESLPADDSVTPSTARVSSTRSSGGESGWIQMARCVYITKDSLQDMCRGFVGVQKNRFCLAAKILGRADCGIEAHAKHKFVPEEETIHAPGAPNRGRPTALVGSSIALEDVPTGDLPFIKTWSKSSQGWIAYFDEANIRVTPISPRAREMLRLDDAIVEGIIERQPELVGFTNVPKLDEKPPTFDPEDDATADVAMLDEVFDEDERQDQKPGAIDLKTSDAEDDADDIPDGEVDDAADAVDDDSIDSEIAEANSKTPAFVSPMAALLKASEAAGLALNEATRMRSRPTTPAGEWSRIAHPDDASVSSFLTSKAGDEPKEQMEEKLVKMWMAMAKKAERPDSHVCAKCGIIGHYGHSCPKPLSCAVCDEDHPTRFHGIALCLFCDEYGHIVATCPLKMSLERKANLEVDVADMTESLRKRTSDASPEKKLRKKPATKESKQPTPYEKIMQSKAGAFRPKWDKESPRYIYIDDWRVDLPDIEGGWDAESLADDNGWCHALLHTQESIEKVLKFAEEVNMQVPMAVQSLEDHLARMPDAPIRHHQLVLEGLSSLLGNHSHIRRKFNSVSNALLTFDMLTKSTKGDVKWCCDQFEKHEEKVEKKLEKQEEKIADKYKVLKDQNEILELKLGNVKQDMERMKESFTRTITNIGRGVRKTLLEWKDQMANVSSTPVNAQGGAFTFSPDAAGLDSPGANSSSPINLDTVLGDVNVAGGSDAITIRTLYTTLRELDVKVNMAINRTSGQSIRFHKWSFPSEEEFVDQFISLNSSGVGTAGFVDLISIWVFAKLDQTPVENWLQALHRSKATGFMNTLETDYAGTFQNPFPTMFVGTKTTEVSPTKKIQLFASLEDWRGTGMSDGTKERMLQCLHQAVERHGQYCVDVFPEGILRETATRSGIVVERTMTFFANLFEDEITRLSHLGLDEEYYMHLVSHQLLNVCLKLHKKRQMAVNVDHANKAATAARYALVTIQALSIMEELVRDGADHPLFVGSFSRFLTRQIAANQATNLSKEIATIKEKVDKELKKKAEGGLDKLDVRITKMNSKLDTVVRINKLKTKE